MPRGPLPNPQRRRANQPTIATTALPAAGRTGPTPDAPASADLSTAGLAWWEWAWHTPQATAWDAGSLYVIARRASLEDDLATMGHLESLDAIDLLRAEDARAFRELVTRLSALAGGRLKVCSEMRELDKVLGLTPKAMADLRWSIDKTEAPAAQEPQEASVRRLRAVEAPGAAASA